MSKAYQYGVAVTELHETQLQESRSQVASRSAKRLHGKSVTMVLMAAGSELNPIAPVIALKHALWDKWMPHATMAKCITVAQHEQLDSARSWAAVKVHSARPRRR